MNESLSPTFTLARNAPATPGVDRARPMHCGVSPTGRWRKLGMLLFALAGALTSRSTRDYRPHLS